MAASPAGSVDYQFVSEPDEALMCLICMEVAKEPWQHAKCGRLFCKRCLESYGSSKPCPTCRAARPSYFEDNRSKREIRSLKVRCANPMGRCEWEGTVATLSQHAEACKLLPCPKGCQDATKKTRRISRQQLARHLEKECPNRDSTCRHCREKGTYTHITQAHDQICQKKIVPCPNTKCTEKVERARVDDHIRNHCGYTIISCKFEEIGCDVKLKRQDMVGHEQEDIASHFQMALDAVTVLKSTVATLQEAHSTMKPGESVLLRLEDFQARKERNEKFQFLPFYTHRHGYLMAIQVYPNGFHISKGTHVSVYARILDGKYNNELAWPFTGTVTVKLLNQLADEHHHTKTIKSNTQVHEVDSASGTLPRGSAKFIAHSQLGHDVARNTQYLLNNVLCFRVAVEVPHRKLWLE